MGGGEDGDEAFLGGGQLLWLKGDFVVSLVQARVDMVMYIDLEPIDREHDIIMLMRLLMESVYMKNGGSMVSWA